jgi:Mrp family chromosome partitioning ATPase
MVIIDTAPILTGSVNRQLLECMDALVLLARWRSTPVRVIREAMRRITAAGGQVSGVALSMVEGIGRERVRTGGAAAIAQKSV